jgi:hypothetical protein
MVEPESTDRLIDCLGLPGKLQLPYRCYTRDLFPQPEYGVVCVFQYYRTSLLTYH